MLMTKLLVLPLVLHVLLAFYVGLKSLRARIRSVRNGGAKMHEIAVDSGAWPNKVRVIGNNFDSQFDSPMMWYGACALIVALDFEDWVLVAMSWCFLVSRMAHSYVHLGSNEVPTRMKLFILGFFITVAMWLWFAGKLLLAQ
jgi:hypothetical protein